MPFRSKTIWRMGVLSAVACLALQFGYLSRYDFNVAALVGMNARIAQEARDIPTDIPVFAKGGHDGGQVYLFARDPLVPRIDVVSFHVERLLFPFTAWVLALGQQAAIPYGLLAANVLATALIGSVAAATLVSRGKRPLWALLCALGPGAAMPLRFSLVDQFQLAWLCAGFHFFVRKRDRIAALCLAAAVLTRPMAIGAVAVVVVVALIQRRGARAILCYVAACVPYAGWRAYLSLAHGYPLNLFTGDTTLVMTSSWPASMATTIAQIGPLRTALLMVTVAFYAFVAVVTLARAWRERRVTLETLLISGYTAAAFVMLSSMGAGPVQMGRLTPIFPFVVYLYAGERRLTSLLIMFGVLGLALFGVFWMLAAPTMV